MVELDAVRAYREGGIITTDTVWRDLADAAIEALTEQLRLTEAQFEQRTRMWEKAEERVREYREWVDREYDKHDRERWNPLDAGFASGIDETSAHADAAIAALEKALEEKLATITEQLDAAESSALHWKLTATQAEERVRELDEHSDTMKRWLRERADLARQDGDIAEYGLRLAYHHFISERWDNAYTEG